MNEIDLLIKRIIPPPTREEREGFSNDHILAELNKLELDQVKERLLQMIKHDDDFLIAETLVKLNSVDATGHMENWLKKAVSPAERIKWASFITEIRNGDAKMETIAFQEFKNFEFKYEVESIIFYDLIKFQSDRINNLIRNFTEHKYFLVSLHAKRVLGLEHE